MASDSTLAKNAASNVLRGGASAAAALFVPPLLTRYLSPQQYSIWALALQLAAYVGYLDLGIQIAVARFIAQATEQKNAARQNQVIASSLLLLSVAGSLAIIGVIIGSLVLPQLYKDLSSSDIREFQICLSVVGFSLALGLPASTLTGVLVGVQRNDIPALAIAVSRVGGALACVCLAHKNHDIAQLAWITAVFNLLPCAPQYFACKRLLTNFAVSLKQINSQIIREIASYCAGLSVWSLGMFLVSGLDLMIVGAVDFAKVGAYSVASTLVLFVAGMTGAVFASLLAPVAVMHTRREHQRLVDLILRCTCLGTFVNLLVGLPMIMDARELLAHWLPPSYAAAAAPILQALAAANLVRLTFTPYAVAVQATGQQNRFVAAALIEGVTNFVVSAIAGHFLGAIGVAFGTVTGAVIAFAWIVEYNIPRTRYFQFTKSRFLREGIIHPLFSMLPMVLALYLWRKTQITSPWLGIACLCLAGATLVTAHKTKIIQKVLQ
jgi:O-antigen/teichoic acid export membrane protein